MTLPAWNTAGSNATSASANSLAPAFASSIPDKDIALLQAEIAAATTISTPAGWNLVDVVSEGVFTAALFWKRCTGSEGSSSVTVNFGATGAVSARITTFINCRSNGTPFENKSFQQGTGNIVTSPALAANGPDELGVHAMGVARNVNTAPPTGWTEQAATDTGGSGLRNTIEWQTIPNFGSLLSSTRDFGTSIPWVAWSLALLPEAARSYQLA